MKDRQIKLISPLENFECVRQKIELSENLRIREVLNTERKLIPDTGKPIPHLMPLHGLPETLKYCLETSYQRRTDVVDPKIWTVH